MLKPIKAFLFTLLIYLFQVCVAPYMKIAGITPNLMIANIAIFTVSYGKKYAFGTAAMTGILLETMSVNVNILIMVIYPVFGVVCAQVFADMSERKREQRRVGHKSQTDKNAYVRILLNTLVFFALFEAVMLIYTSLTGITVTGTHLMRTAQGLLYTLFSALTVMIPLRWALGMYQRRKPVILPKEGAVR
jgi:hypothetical protein